MKNISLIITEKAILTTALLLTALPLFGQVHHIPFGSQGNKIELDVINETAQSSDLVTVIVAQAPAWVTFKERKQTVATLSVGEAITAEFEFDLTTKAPVETTGTIRFDVFSKGKRLQSKQVEVSSEVPEEFRLFTNYPNPFNPSTTISYQLPSQMDVTIQVYNILGQKVTELVNTRQLAGLKQVTWDASAQASGMYLYRVVARSEGGKKFTSEGKMMLIK